MRISNATLLLVLVAVVIVIAGIQALQISSLTAVIKSGSFAAAGSAQGSSILSGLASQVGGCGG